MQTESESKGKSKRKPKQIRISKKLYRILEVSKIEADRETFTKASSIDMLDHVRVHVHEEKSLERIVRHPLAAKAKHQFERD